MRRIFLMLCISASCFANAQKKITYTGSVTGGLLIGKNPLSSFIFMTQGISYKQYTLSAGSGIDFYAFRSVPVFMDVKRKFGKQATQLFIEAAAGINFTSSGSKDAKFWYQYAEGDFKNGFFVKGGGGLLFRAQKKLKVSLSAGYSYKTASYKYKRYDTDPWFWQTEPIKDIYHYNRWYIGAGIIW